MDTVRSLWNVDVSQDIQDCSVKFPFVRKHATEKEVTVGSLENADVRLDGGARTVTSVIPIQAV